MKWTACIAALTPVAAWAQIDYTLNVDVPAKSVQVTVKLASTDASQEFRIPAWCPGFYFIQSYEKKISDVVATDSAGNRLEIKPTDSRGWAVANPSLGPVSFSYRVVGDDGGLGFFGVSVRDHAVFVNGPAAFVYPSGRLTEPCRLTIGNLPNRWQIATAMDPDQASYKAAGYDEFIDHPIQLGVFERRTFDVESIPFTAVFVPATSSKMNCSPDLEVDRLRQVSLPPLQMFGGAPFKRYLYIVHLSPGSFNGGLEHRASNVINTEDFNPLAIDDLAAHEYFHAWNVKHIRPKVLGPFDYAKQVRTGNLWFAEGVTDYYAYRTTYRAQLQDEVRMLETYAMQIAELQGSRKRLQKTIEEVSIGAWETGGFGDDDLSYYTKGSIIGLLLDAAIRDATKGVKSLDDVMRLLYRNHRLPKPGFEEDSLRVAINEVAGADLSAIYSRMVRSKQEMPYELLGKIGYRLEEPGKRYPFLEFAFRGQILTSVQGPLARAGLRAGDQLVSVNGQPFSASAMAGLRAGDTLKIEAKRGDRVGTFTAPLPSRVAPGYRIVRDPFASGEATRRMQEWLQR